MKSWFLVAHDVDIFLDRELVLILFSIPCKPTPKEQPYDRLGFRYWVHWNATQDELLPREAGTRNAANGYDQPANVNRRHNLEPNVCMTLLQRWQYSRKHWSNHQGNADNPILLDHYLIKEGIVSFSGIKQTYYYLIQHTNFVSP